mmetsp:Transcript_17058/g.54385  ORF Transcript_17058/g.54385 Transcript_17058/m.54385 type:complete len:161 (-) Transcript_17058:769-1251(-)
MSASITLPERYTVFRQTVAQRVLGEADSYELAQVAELPVGKLASRHKLSPAAVASFDAAADAWTRWAAYEQSDDPDFIQQVLSKEAGDQISTLCLISRTAIETILVLVRWGRGGRQRTRERETKGRPFVMVMFIFILPSPGMVKRDVSYPPPSMEPHKSY